LETRVCKVFNNLENIDKSKWTGIKSILEVKRTVKYKDKTTEETAYFISSLSPQTGAKIFNEGIRGHWSIESFHYIKDVVFGEDRSKVKTKNAPCNYSIIRNLVINIFRKNNLNSMQGAIEKCANNVPFMMSLF
jgi:predicted transposase YbfD/YdcC